MQILHYVSPMKKYQQGEALEPESWHPHISNGLDDYSMQLGPIQLVPASGNIIVFIFCIVHWIHYALRMSLQMFTDLLYFVTNTFFIVS